MSMTQEEFQKRYQYNPNTDCLGEGGFGKVYKAYDTHRDRYVAIKMAEVKPHLEEVRLRKEVEIISKLPTHPNIAYYEECYTFSTFAGEYDFGVLQYYERGNLQQLLTDKELTYEQKDSLLKQILEGIVFLHNQGIIHRDLKPQNILVALNRNGDYIPKITDFGISKKLDVNKSSVFTNSLAGVGTLAFASPEQLTGQTIRKNTDLWSFGVIACWIFTGKLPFNTGSQNLTSEAGRIELFRQINSGEVSYTITQLPSAWQSLVKQCIVVDSERRVGADKCLELLGRKIDTVDKNAENKKNQLKKGVSQETFIDKWETKNNKTIIVNSEHFYLKKKYDKLGSFKGGIASVKFKEKWGFINRKGEEIIPCTLDEVQDFSEKFCSVKKDNYCYLIDENGGGFFYRGRFSEGYKEGIAPVQKLKTHMIFNKSLKYGFINKGGIEIIPCVYDNAWNFSDGLANVEKKSKWGFINKIGEMVINFKYEMCRPFSNGLATVQENDKWGFINKDGKEVIPFIYDRCWDFSDELAPVEKEKKWGFINKEGKEIVPFIYEFAMTFSEGLSRVNKSGKWGYIDINGNEVISCRYDDSFDFSEGLAKVKLDNAYGFIDNKGKVIIPFLYEDIELSYFWKNGASNSFSEGLYPVFYKGEWFYIDQTGEKVSFCNN